MLSYYEMESEENFIFDCSEVKSLPTIDVLFGGYWLEVLVSDYVENRGTGICSFNLRIAYDTEQAILGTTFMKHFYIVHDMDNM